MIYLDSNATSQIHPEVLDAMLPFLRDQYFNPSGGYRASRLVKAAVENARDQVAALLGADPGEIVFTGCGTESDNAALASAIAINPDRRHIVTTEVEHTAIHAQCEEFEKEGIATSMLGVNSAGLVDPGELRDVISTKDTVPSSSRTSLIDFTTVSSRIVAPCCSASFNAAVIAASGRTNPPPGS